MPRPRSRCDSPWLNLADPLTRPDSDLLSKSPMKLAGKVQGDMPMLTCLPVMTTPRPFPRPDASPDHAALCHPMPHKLDVNLEPIPKVANPENATLADPLQMPRVDDQMRVYGMAAKLRERRRPHQARLSANRQFPRQGIA